MIPTWLPPKGTAGKGVRLFVCLFVCLFAGNIPFLNGLPSFLPFHLVAPRSRSMLVTPKEAADAESQDADNRKQVVVIGLAVAIRNT